MKILVDIGHPAHVHLFKNMIRILQKKGHTVYITARDKEIALALLQLYKLDYTRISHAQKGLLNIIREMLRRDYALFNFAKKMHPDLMIAVLDPSITHVGRLLNIATITMTDTEHAKLANLATFPFADAILTPEIYTHDIGKKQIRYNGYHELAYLHTNHFQPDPGVLDELGLKEDDRFIVVRFISWNASHDVGHHGIPDKIGFIRSLAPYGRILISSEEELPLELQPYAIHISPEKIHDILYYAALYIGEGATMASEAAILGTPSVFVSSLAGTMGNFVELEKTYNLVYSFQNSDNALTRAKEILTDPQSREKWQINRQRLMKDKIDVTAFMIWFVETYPASFESLKEQPGA